MIAYPFLNFPYDLDRKPAERFVRTDRLKRSVFFAIDRKRLSARRKKTDQNHK
jgi:hypothetical protein